TVQTTPKVAGGGKVDGLSSAANHALSAVLPAYCPERNPSSITPGIRNNAQRIRLARSWAGEARRFIVAPVRESYAVWRVEFRGAISAVVRLSETPRCPRSP